MTQNRVNDDAASRGADAGSTTAPPWAFTITRAAAQLINASHRVFITPRSSSDKPVGRVEGILPHVVDAHTISFHLPGGAIRELAGRPLSVCEGVLTIAFGLSSELALWGTILAITPVSEPGSSPADQPEFQRVEFRMAFLAFVAEASSTRDMAGRGGKIPPLSQLEMEGLLARCSQ